MFMFPQSLTNIDIEVLPTVGLYGAFVKWPGFESKSLMTGSSDLVKSVQGNLSLPTPEDKAQRHDVRTRKQLWPRNKYLPPLLLNFPASK